VTRRHATFNEANAWVHLRPAWFRRHLRSIRSVWQAEDGRVWVEDEGSPGVVYHALAQWELAAQRTGEPVLPCGCRVRVRYRRHARETVCTFSNETTTYRTTLRISGLLMLIASAPSHLHEAVCVHPHDEGTVQAQLEQALSEARAQRLARTKR
jgi:hypothetical protein